MLLFLVPKNALNVLIMAVHIWQLHRLTTLQVVQSCWFIFPHQLHSFDVSLIADGIF